MTVAPLQENDGIFFWLFRQTAHTVEDTVKEGRLSRVCYGHQWTKESPQCQ